MRHIFLIIIFFFATLSIQAQTIENGVVKEYHGKEVKTNLSGVELMVKGAPSTVSDLKGEFSLKFSTLKPGDKIEYSEIYKEGYVIFNKDALDAWRISNKGNTFTIVMCKESDFRALKKKFYGIIEKSYYEDYKNQLAIAVKAISDELELRQKIKQIETEYNEKMGNINTYVELFSRIDRNEMNEIETRSLEYLEEGDIDKAIETYEELKIKQQVSSQLSKWDAANEMQKSAEFMISEALSDLTLLINKIQKQIILYEMGGYLYNEKLNESKDELISLLYRIKPYTGTEYNELLGSTIIKHRGTKNTKGLNAYKEAAALPSGIGRYELAKFYECLPPTEQLVDTIRNLYAGALEIITNPEDSLFQKISDNFKNIPEGFYRHSDGNTYPYRIMNDGTAQLIGYGQYYSTPLVDSIVKLPDCITINNCIHKVTGIGTFAFGNNPNLRKVILPKFCKNVEYNSFDLCDSLTIVVNSELEFTNLPFLNQFSTSCVQLEFADTPIYTNWILKHYKNIRLNRKMDATPIQYALAKHFSLKGDKSKAVDFYTDLIMECVKYNKLDDAITYSTELRHLDKKRSHSMLSYYFERNGNLETAITEARKGLDKHYLISYQHLAYLYSKRNKAKDFISAHEMIDEAIASTNSDKERALFLDTKGELFLMQGMEEEAKKYHKLSIETNFDYISNCRTKLFKHFSEIKNISLKNIDNLNDSIKIKQNRYKELVKVVGTAARHELQIIQQFNNLQIPTYEELTSIGLIALNAMLKNKSINQLSVYSDEYVNTVIKWAIRHELPHRYPWYETVTTYFKLFFIDAGIEVGQLANLIKECIKTMPSDYRACCECFFAKGNTSELFTKETIQGMLQYIKDYLTEHGVNNWNSK